jgi:putative ABC transport system permease protein
MENKLAEFFRRLSMLLRRERFESDLDEEMRLHRELRERDHVEMGMTVEEAHYAALRRFGNIALIQERSREMWGWSCLETTIQDMRYGLRQLRRSPGFTAVALLSLALGIGANTAIFQLLDAVRLRMLPVTNPQELAEIHLTNRHGRLGSFFNWHAQLTNAIWERIRHDHSAFSGVFAWAPDNFDLSPRGEVHLVPGIWVSGDFFNVLGVRPVLGRLFTSSDDRRGCGASSGVVISYGFWQRELGGDPSSLGRKLTIDYHPVEIIGITPPSFFGLEVGRSFDVALPICSQPVLGGENNYLDTPYDWWLTVMGRLKARWSLEKATAQLNSASPGIFEATLPAGYDAEHTKKYLAFKLAAYPAGQGISSLRETSSAPLGLLLAITGLVLLIACANLANLMLARATTRERELAVRLAMGASRTRLIRQLVSESLLLAVSGAGLGFVAARVSARFLVSFFNTQGNPVFVNLATDWRIFAFIAGVAMLSTLLFGLVPALRAAGIAPIAAMKASGGGLTASRERFGLRRTLVVSQVAFSLVLLVGALLFSRSLRNLLTVDVGFRRTGILVVDLDFTRLNLSVTRRQVFRHQLVEQLRSTPGVDSAAEAFIVPTSGSSMNRDFWMDGSDPLHTKDSWVNLVSTGFFKTMGIPLLAGRDFNDQDRPGSPQVAIVNEAFAREFANDRNPIGKRFWQKAEPETPKVEYEIIGVVKDTKYRDIREQLSPIVYLPTSQDTNPDQSDQIVIRSHVPLVDLTTRVKKTIAQANPDISLQFRALQTMIRDWLLGERLMATLSGLFGFLGALLAGIGVYGVMSYLVLRRTNEIGIRMTLGADKRKIFSLIMRETGILLGAGLAVGLGMSLPAGRTASSLLFGLRPYDPVTLVAAVGLLAAVGGMASFLPARRATKVDPMLALRYE